MMLAAPNRLGILAGYALAAMARAVIVGALLFAVALATGMQVGGDGVDLFGLIVLALLVNITATLWAAGVAMRLRTIQAGPAMQMPVFIVLFLAPVYVPLALLVGLGPRGRAGQPVHGAGRGRARPDLGRRRPHRCSSTASRSRCWPRFAVWGVRGLRRAEAAG